jgi:hypothetical protein
MMPTAASLNLNIVFSPFITFFTGFGPDYLYYKEDFKGNTSEGNLGGWHGKAGFKLYADDMDFNYHMGIILDAVYSRIDRMGSNEEDIGGLTYSIGLLYRF